MSFPRYNQCDPELYCNFSSSAFFFQSQLQRQVIKFIPLVIALEYYLNYCCQLGNTFMGRSQSDRKKIILKHPDNGARKSSWSNRKNNWRQLRYKRRIHALLSRTLDDFISRLCFAFCFLSLIDGYTLTWHCYLPWLTYFLYKLCHCFQYYWRHSNSSLLTNQIRLW